jgi:hypothetical protein
VALLAEAGPEFTPGAYLYLEAGDGAGQAEFFALHAGSLPGFVIWVDLERSGSGASPSVNDAIDAVAQLRVNYPRNRIGLYANQSFTGPACLTFADLLWSPHYVDGSGTPEEVYRNVPASFWDSYGGMTPVMVQFSQTVMVAGVMGQADCSAFRGSAAQMRAALLGEVVPPKPSPAPAISPEDAVLIFNVNHASLAGATWPGVFLLASDATLHHISSQADLLAYQAAGLKEGTFSYAEYKARGGQ